MRIVFHCDNDEYGEVSPSWNADNMPWRPVVGDFIQWKLGGFQPGLYQVESVVWQLDGTHTVNIWIRFIKP